LPNVLFHGIPHSVPQLVRSGVIIASLLLVSTIAHSQTLVPSKLPAALTETPKKDSVQVILRETPPQVITKEPSPVTTTKAPEVITKPKPQVVLKKKSAEATVPITSEPIRPIAHYSFKTPEGRQESVPVITHYYPNQIVYPLAKADRHLDPKLTRAASIAEDRAHAHSRSLCWHYVKEALLASGVIDSRPKSELARDAAQDLVANYGFTKLAVRDPFAAPIGSVLVYGTSRSVGHVEIRTRDGFVSDFRSTKPSRRPLIGVYAKL
jgi:hypothetical protein